MAGVEYSIYFSSSAAGVQSINILKAPSTLVGLMFTGQYLGIILDPVRTAYVPNTGYGGIDTPMIPVAYTFEGLQMNIVFQSAGQVSIFYFGYPLGDEISLEAYSGSLVSFSGSNSGTSPANVTTLGTINFPQGNLRLTGIAYLTLDNNDTYDIWSFTTTGGLLIQSMSVQGVGIGGRFVILPLDDVPVAQTLTINVTMYNVAAGKTHQAILIAYYEL